jgi:hypothetical protein
MNSSEQWALMSVGAVVLFLLLSLFFAKAAKIAKPTPTTAQKTDKPSTPAAADAGIAQKVKNISSQKLKIYIIIFFAALLVIQIFIMPSNPYKDTGNDNTESEPSTYSINVTGATKKITGANWVNFTAGKDGANGELKFISYIKPGKCAKVTFSADKEGGKIKMIFRPLNEISSALEGEEIIMTEVEGSTSLCYGKEASGQRAEAVVLFDAPEGSATRIKTE